MTVFYSAARAGFFDDTIHLPLPEDARPISAAAHSALMAAQQQGKRIVADDKGDPVAEDYPAPTSDQLMDRLRRERDQRLTACDWTQLSDVPLAQPARDLWTAYRQALRDLPETCSGDPLGVAWPTPPEDNR